MARTKYSRTTVGQSAQVFVAKQIAYTDDATYEAFINNAVDGEIGVFLVYDASGPTTYKESVAATNAADAALQANDRFFIAQMSVHTDVNGEVRRLVKRTPTYTYSEFKVRQVAYIAPVKQVSNIGYTGTAGTSLNSGTLTTGQIFSMTLRETTPGNQPFPTWNYEETAKAGDTLIAIGARLLKQINSSLSAMNQANGRLANAELITNGTFVASSGGAATMVNGSTTFTIVESAGAAADAGKYNADGSNMAAGQYLRIGGTTDASPVYKIAAVSNVGTALATITLESPYMGASGSVAAANLLVNTVAPTEIGFKFTAINNYSHFVIAVQEDMASATVTYTTPYKEGSGTSDQVAQLEEEGHIFAGYTTLNTNFVDDWGKPVSYTVAGTTYSFIMLDYIRTQKSMAAPKVQDTHYGSVIIAAPTGAQPFTQIDGIFV